jgi:hypothetical protein
MEPTSGQEKLIFSGEAEEAQSEKIRQAFARARTSPGDVWFVREDGKILNAFVNGDRAWLMYRLDESDAGFSSRDPSYAGPQNAVLPYLLTSNGQLDEYPVSWTIALDEAIRAVEYFVQTGENAPWITWHDDYFQVECFRKNRRLLEVLAYGDRAWLKYRRRKSDPGFTSRDPAYTGPKETLHEFALQSGQRVVYPVAWTISKQEAVRAVNHFLRTGEKAPWIIWHNPTGDQERED